MVMLQLPAKLLVALLSADIERAGTPAGADARMIAAGDPVMVARLEPSAGLSGAAHADELDRPSAIARSRTQRSLRDS